jgi:hypothetical protein
MPPQKEPTAQEIRERMKEVSAYLRHENDLVNHRLTWMWTLQGFLLTAYSLLLKDGGDAVAASVVCVIGMVTCLSIGYSLFISEKILDKTNAYCEEMNERLDLTLGYDKAKVQPPPRSFWRFLFPWKLLPRFFLFAWLFLAGYTLTKSF